MADNAIAPMTPRMPSARKIRVGGHGVILFQPGLEEGGQMLVPVRLICHRETRLSQNGKFRPQLSANSPQAVNHPARPLPCLISPQLKSNLMPAHPIECLPIKTRPRPAGRAFPFFGVAIPLFALCTGHPSILHPAPYPLQFTKRPLFLLQLMRRPLDHDRANAYRRPGLCAKGPFRLSDDQASLDPVLTYAVDHRKVFHEGPLPFRQ